MLAQACLAGLTSTCLMPLFLTRDAFFHFFNLLRFLPSQSLCPEHLLSSPLPRRHLFISQTSGLSWHFLVDLEIRSVSHILWFYRSGYYSCRVFSTVAVLCSVSLLSMVCPLPPPLACQFHNGKDNFHSQHYTLSASHQQCDRFLWNKQPFFFFGSH